MRQLAHHTHPHPTIEYQLIWKTGLQARPYYRTPTANTSALLLHHCCCEVWVFIGDPIDKFADIGIFEQALRIHAMALQFRIGEIGNNRLLTNAVHWHDIAPTSAFWNGMMPDDGFTRRATAQPAWWRDRGGVLVMIFVIVV
jgi:hypothetical protein